MSFTTEGHAPFPNLHSDVQEIVSVAEWSDAQLDFKTNQYGDSMQREDIQPRARKAGDFMLERLIFELSYRDGIFDEMLRVEDEVCDGV